MSRPFEDPRTGLTGSFFCGKDGTRRMQINAGPRTVQGVGFSGVNRCFVVLDDRMVAFLFGVILEEARRDQQRGGFAGQEGRSLAPLVTRTPQSAVTWVEASRRGYCLNDDCACYGDDHECPRDDCDWPSPEPGDPRAPNWARRGVSRPQRGKAGEALDRAAAAGDIGPNWRRYCLVPGWERPAPPRPGLTLHVDFHGVDGTSVYWWDAEWGSLGPNSFTAFAHQGGLPDVEDPFEHPDTGEGYKDCMMAYACLGIEP